MRDLGMSIGWGSGCPGWTCLRCCKKGRHAPKKHQLRLLQRQMFGWWAKLWSHLFWRCACNMWTKLLWVVDPSVFPALIQHGGRRQLRCLPLLQVSLQGSKNCENSWHFYDFLCPSQLELRVFQAKVMYDAGCAPTVVKDRSSRAKPSHTSGACFPKEISGSTACLRGAHVAHVQW